MEWRWRIPRQDLPNFRQPRWEGQPLAGRAILLVGEQGLGDIIQMIRFARLLKQSDATVLVQCRPELQALLKTVAGFDRFVDPGETNRESFDFQVPLLSLPGVLGTTVETIPAEVPYVFAESGPAERWRRELDTSRGLAGPRTCATRFARYPWPSSRRWPIARASSCTACRKATAASNWPPWRSACGSWTWEPDSTSRAGRLSTRRR
jgi:hypothetical protein